MQNRNRPSKGRTGRNRTGDDTSLQPQASDHGWTNDEFDDDGPQPLSNDTALGYAASPKRGRKGRNPDYDYVAGAAPKVYGVDPQRQPSPARSRRPQGDTGRSRPAGPRRDDRSANPSRRDDRGPRPESRDDRGPRRDERGPRRDDRGPRPNRRDDRGPRPEYRDDRGARPDFRDSRGPRRGPQQRPSQPSGRGPGHNDRRRFDAQPPARRERSSPDAMIPEYAVPKKRSAPPQGPRRRTDDDRAPRRPRAEGARPYGKTRNERSAPAGPDRRKSAERQDFGPPRNRQAQPAQGGRRRASTPGFGTPKRRDAGGMMQGLSGGALAKARAKTDNRRSKAYSSDMFVYKENLDEQKPKERTMRTRRKKSSDDAGE
ncbi:MAG: hypothetical protein MUC47_00885 [Candidatus Kapabacteria bacterium]|nr:hypothetical protein [Candidatus Kapabacteria bacterium]